MTRTLGWLTIWAESRGEGRRAGRFTFSNARREVNEVGFQYPVFGVWFGVSVHRRLRDVVDDYGQVHEEAN